MATTNITKLLGHLMGYRSTVTTETGYQLSDGVKYGTATCSASLFKVLLMTNPHMLTMYGRPVGRDGFRNMAAYIRTKDYVAAEIQTSETTWDVAVYNIASEKVMAGTYDSSTGITTAFEIGFGKRNGTVILLSLLPIIAEKDANYTAKLEHMIDVKDDALSMEEALAELSDVVYYHLKESKTGISMVEKEKSGTPYWKAYAISTASVKSGAYGRDPIEVVGEPTFFKTTSFTPLGKTLTFKKVKGAYAYGKQDFTEEQKSRIPVMDDKMVVAKEAVDIAKKIQMSSDCKMPIRVVALTGPAGTGKTVMAKQIAAMLNRPYRVCNGSPDMERFDVIAQLMPTVNSINEAAEKTAEKFDIPSIEEALFDPEGVYQTLTGKEAPYGYDVEDALALREKILKEKIVKEANGTGNDFQMVLSEIVTALRDGEVVEFMEADLIRQAGVLASLNNILDINSGVGVLPNGETFKVNKDAVVIFTMNLDLEGCNALNQSFLDRLQLMVHIDTPPTAVVVERIMNQTDCTNKKLVEQCVKIMEDLASTCKDQGITDGVVGVRSVISWINNAWLNEKCGIDEPVKKAALDTIINKSTLDQEQREVFYEEFIREVDFESPSGK